MSDITDQKRAEDEIKASLIEKEAMMRNWVIPKLWDCSLCMIW